jgi:hypothetical protein
VWGWLPIASRVNVQEYFFHQLLTTGITVVFSDTLNMISELDTLAKQFQDAVLLS